MAAASEIVQVMRGHAGVTIVTTQTVDVDVAVFNAREQLQALKAAKVRIIICLTDPMHYPIIWAQAAYVTNGSTLKRSN